MKKGLIGTSALVAATVASGAAFAQESGAPTLSISGTSQVEYIVNDYDVDRAASLAGRNASGVTTLDGVDGDGMDVDNNINFDFEGTADNGLIYGGRTDFELSSASTDEAYIYFEGGWGLVHLGADDGTVDNMVPGGENVLAGAALWDGGPGIPTAGSFNDNGEDSDGDEEAIRTGTATTAATLAASTGDASKIAYYSPTFAGLQFGASYTPEATQNGMDSPLTDDRANQSADVWNANALYTFAFDGVSGSVGVGYMFGSESVGNEDTQGLMAGGTVSFAGFALGVGYGDNFETGCASDAEGCDGGGWWNVGASYSAGPAVIYAGYFESDADPAGDEFGDDEFTTYGLGVDYTLAEGLSTHAEISWFEDDDSTPFDDAPDNVFDGDGTQFILGTTISY